MKISSGTDWYRSRMALVDRMYYIAGKIRGDCRASAWKDDRSWWGGASAHTESCWGRGWGAEN